jgi:dynein assembly factor 1, axonemal
MCRKTLIACLPELTYLDDRPIFPNEREIAAAWFSGGIAAERAARDSIRDRERQRDRRNFEFMQAIRSEAFRQVQPLYGPSLALGRELRLLDNPHLHSFETAI